MTGIVLRGLGASPGIAVGQALALRDVPAERSNGVGGPLEVERALEALAAVAAELSVAAGRLREAGLGDEAEIVQTSQMLAEDPVLRDDVVARAAAAPAPRAVAEAVEQHAQVLEALPDPVLSARAADVRELGRRAARILSGAARLSTGGRSVVVVARDLGPGEVAELDAGDGRVAAVALANGAATSHAAIMARALGVPLVVGLGPSLLAVEEGELLIVDGDRGVVVVAPAAGELEAARAAVRSGEKRRRANARLRSLPAETADGHRIRLLCNASTAAEVTAGLAAGAEGVGLLRTELAFLGADHWPTEEEHRASLEPLLCLLAGRVVTVRTLDFGADKTPPFLAGAAERGLALMLAHGDALTAQLRAIVAAGRDAQLRVLLPLVRSPADVEAVRRLLQEALPEGIACPTVGAMIETPEAALAAGDIARAADFLSIGTNDLVATTLELDRDAPVASVLSAAEPAVLRLVARVVDAAHAAGVTVEVCGESASEPSLAALFVGLGVDELSVAPARLDEVRATIRGISTGSARAAATAALAAGSGDAALAAVAHHVAAQAGSAEPGDDRGQALHGLSGLVA